MNTSRMLKFAAIACSCALLAACEPSESDIRSAVERQAASEAQAMKQMLGGMAPPAPTLKSIKKIGCKEDGSNAYKCDIEILATLGGQEKKGIISGRLVKGSDGWAMAK